MVYLIINSLEFKILGYQRSIMSPLMRSHCDQGLNLKKAIKTKGARLTSVTLRTEQFSAILVGILLRFG